MCIKCAMIFMYVCLMTVIFLCLFVGKKLLAYYDNQYSTIRHTNCLWLCDSSHTIINQCCVCNKYQRNVLNSALTTERVKLHAISPAHKATQTTGFVVHQKNREAQKIASYCLPAEESGATLERQTGRAY